MMDEHPTFVKCKCGQKAYRNWSSYTVKIPEHFQSQSELYSNNTASDFNYISNRMTHGIRPSGKQKAVY